MNIEQEIAYYKANRKALTELYERKFIIIKDCSVAAVFDTRTQANEAGLSLATGSFIIERPMNVLK